MSITKMNIEGVDCEVITTKTEHSTIFLIKGKNGVLGCGYFNLEAANTFGDAFVIITGATNLDEMLNFPISHMSEKAKTMGVTDRMTGKLALVKMG